MLSVGTLGPNHRPEGVPGELPAHVVHVTAELQVVLSAPGTIDGQHRQVRPRLVSVPHVTVDVDALGRGDGVEV